MTHLQYLETIRDNTLAQLASLSALEKPTSGTSGGAWTYWTPYLIELRNRLDWINEQIAGLDPPEVTSQAYTD